MYIWAKIGTHPAGHYRVLRKKKTPVVGDCLVLREQDAWQDEHVRVTEIKQLFEGPLFYVERF